MTKFCPYCGSPDVKVSLGINGSEYAVCQKCRTACNIFEDEKPLYADFTGRRVSGQFKLTNRFRRTA